LVDVLASVLLDDNRSVETGEVADIQADLMLAPEFEAVELTAA